MSRYPGGAGHSWPPAAGNHSWSLKQPVLRGRRLGPSVPSFSTFRLGLLALQTWASDPSFPKPLSVAETLGET